MWEAVKLFEETPDSNVMSWTAMISGVLPACGNLASLLWGYALHGYGNDALQLFEHMECHGERPDDLTFLGILTACCHGGFVDDGRKYFDRMTRYYQIEPALKHYGCLVDLLGRAGHLNEARDLINKMPMKPDVAVWGSLLGACGIHINIEVGEYAAEHLLELDPTNGSHYVALSNMYAAAGRWDDVKRIRKMMKDRNVLRVPGSSWIEINNQVHAFLTGDK
ncbi:hypothetical protein SUGI_0392610 [Cryptomeria japonica]|nr:hypothetical protein SUGI_0392610 [Cryptomeria japonica]